MGIKKRTTKGLVSLATSLLLVGTLVAGESSEIEHKVLTLEYAIESAMGLEDKVGVLQQQIEAYDEQLDLIDDYSSMLYYSTKYAQDSVVQEKDLLEDKVAYNVIVLYNAINLMQKQIELNEIEIAIAEKELKQAEVKMKHNRLSELNLNEVEVALQKKQAEYKKNQLHLSDYQNQFYNLTHIYIDTYDDIEEQLNYESLDYPAGTNGLIASNVNYYLENTESYIAYQKENIIDYTQYKYGINTGIPINLLKSAEAEVAQSSYNTQQQKKQMIESLQSCVTELEKLQETIVIQQKEIEVQKNNLIMTQIRYENGYASQLELQKAEQMLTQLELAHIQNIYTYQQQKMILEKPWVRY